MDLRTFSKSTLIILIFANSKAQAVKVCIALAVFCTFGLQFFVCLEIGWNSIKDNFTERPTLVNYVMRTVLVTAAVLLAVAVPTISPFIGVIGAFCFSILGLLVPVNEFTMIFLQSAPVTLIVCCSSRFSIKGCHRNGHILGEWFRSRQLGHLEKCFRLHIWCVGISVRNKRFYRSNHQTICTRIRCFTGSNRNRCVDDFRQQFKQLKIIRFPSTISTQLTWTTTCWNCCIEI